MLLFNVSMELVVCFIHRTCTINKVKDARRLLVIFQSIDNRFVVSINNERGIFCKTFLLEYLALIFEYVLNIKTLKSFIGEIDKKLFKRILNKYFKSKNIQNSYGSKVFQFSFWNQSLIELQYNP